MFTLSKRIVIHDMINLLWVFLIMICNKILYRPITSLDLSQLSLLWYWVWLGFSHLSYTWSLQKINGVITCSNLHRADVLKLRYGNLNPQYFPNFSSNCQYNSALLNATLSRNWRFVLFGLPHSLWWQHNCHQYKSQVLNNLSGANYKQNSLRHDSVKNWSTHLCNAVILPSHWSYIVQKQVIEGRSSWDRDTIRPVTRHCTTKIILKLVF